MIPRQCGSHVGGTGCPRSHAFRELGFHRRTSRTNCRQLGSDQIARLSRIAVVTSPLHSSYGLQTTTLATWGLSRSYNQAAQVPSSKVTDKVPRSPAKNSRMVEAFVSRMDSITTLPLESITATEMVA